MEKRLRFLLDFARISVVVMVTVMVTFLSGRFYEGNGMYGIALSNKAN